MVSYDNIKFGEVYTVLFEPNEMHKISGWHPCIVISNDIGNKFSPNIHIIPVTTKNKGLPTHVKLTVEDGFKSECYAQCESSFPISKQLLQYRLFTLPEEKMIEIGKAFMISTPFAAVMSADELLDAANTAKRYISSRWSFDEPPRP